MITNPALLPPMQEEYWVNVYQGIQPYQCHKFTDLQALYSTPYPSFDRPIYRIHVKMKPVKSINTTGTETLLRITGKFDFNWMD